MKLVNTKLLEKIIAEKGIKKGKLCKELNLSYSQLRRKIHNEYYFTADEMHILCRVLGITDLSLKEAIFFNDNVDI